MIRIFCQMVALWFVASSLLILFLWGVFEVVVTVGTHYGVRAAEAAINAFGLDAVLFLLLEIVLVIFVIILGTTLAEEE